MNVKQLEQMMEWKKELINLDNHKVDMLTEYIEETLSTRITEVGKKKLKRWLMKYDFKDLVYATDKALQLMKNLIVILYSIKSKELLTTKTPGSRIY